MSGMISGSEIRRKRIGGLSYFYFPGFPAAHAFFTRRGGISEPPYDTLNTAYKTGDPRSYENRRILIETLNLPNHSLYVLNPCHGDHIAHIETRDVQMIGETVLINTEGAFTNVPDTYFLISSADCIILLITASDASFIGVVHLGWRNLVDGLAEKTVREAASRYQTTVSDLKIAVSPCIYPCCYIFDSPSQIDDPFWKPFLNRTEAGGYAVDLVSALKSQLRATGVRSGDIFESGLCTGCNKDLFFSVYRNGYVSGRFPSLIGLRAGSPSGME